MAESNHADKLRSWDKIVSEAEIELKKDIYLTEKMLAAVGLFIIIAAVSLSFTLIQAMPLLIYASTPTEAQTAQPTPALYLKFDETAGTTAYDSSIGGNNAALRNGATWTTGATGNALRLDGINDYAYIGTTSDLDFANSITIAAWIKPTTTARQQDIICRNWQTSHRGYELKITSSGEIAFRINPSASSYAYRTSSGAALTANIWQHVAATYDGTNIRFYKNGALVSTVAAGGRLYPEESDLFVGTYQEGGENYFSGAIDELRVYDKSLTSTEISQIYATTPRTTLQTTIPRTTLPTTIQTTILRTTLPTTIPRTTVPPTTVTTMPKGCSVGQGYTFTSPGTYTANSASGLSSFSRPGQYTFYETPHNYLDNMNCPWSGTYTCPTGTNIKFYLKSRTERDYDYFNIRNTQGATYSRMTGDYGSSYVWIASPNQRTASFNFASDGSVTDWGVDLYKIECATGTTVTTLPNYCRAGPGYTFTSPGTYTANSASGLSSFSRPGQYTFYETPHNYLDNMNCPWSGTYTCPTGTNIRLYLRAQTEANYDFLNIKNNQGTTYAAINGNYLTSYGWSTYSQRTAAFQFKSDDSVVNWGIDIYQIECYIPPTQTTPRTTLSTTVPRTTLQTTIPRTTVPPTTVTTIPQY